MADSLSNKDDGDTAHGRLASTLDSIHALSPHFHVLGLQLAVKVNFALILGNKIKKFYQAFQNVHVYMIHFFVYTKPKTFAYYRIT